MLMQCTGGFIASKQCGGVVSRVCVTVRARVSEAVTNAARPQVARILRSARTWSGGRGERRAWSLPMNEAATRGLSSVCGRGVLAVCVGVWFLSRVCVCVRVGVVPFSCVCVCAVCA